MNKTRNVQMKVELNVCYKIYFCIYVHMYVRMPVLFVHRHLKNTNKHFKI